jgi:hypothetical protein
MPQNTAQASRQPSIPVLVAIHSDGFVEVFGDKQVDAVVVNVPATGSKRGEVLAEEFIELNIPARHRHIYVPGLVRAAKLGRVVTPDDIHKSQTMIAMLRALDQRSFSGAKEAAQWQG